MTRSRSPFSLASDALTLAGEANAVIALRAFGFASGRTSTREASRMVSEKALALMQAQQAMAISVLTGKPERALPSMVAIYRRAARANRIRLSRGKP